MAQTIYDQDVKPKSSQNSGVDKAKLLKRAKALETDGRSWIKTFKELASYCYPTRGSFDSGTPNDGSKIDHKLLIDEEATHDADIFAAGMTSGFTSPSRPWFEIFLEEDALMDIHAVKEWLDNVRDKMLDIFHKSNVYSALHSMYVELCVFSNACAHIEEDYDNVIMIRVYTAGEYYLGDKAFYRRFYMTVGEMVNEFGKENCSPTVRQAYDDNRIEDKRRINHLIEANDNRVPFKVDAFNMPFRSAYWEDGVESDNTFLKLGGYEEYPILSPKWDITTTADKYGKGGPGWKSLGSIKELQKKAKNMLIGIDKTTNPPLQADASVQGEVNTLPGGLTRFSAQLPNAGVKPTYQVNLDLGALDASIEKTKQTIKQFFFTNLFMMLVQVEQQGRQITATEIVEKQNERLSLIGPILERWQGSDFIKSLIERTFYIGMRNNQFPEPPDELRDKELKIRYTSVLAQAQKMVEITNIDQWVASVLAVAEADPKSIDTINFDEYHKTKAEMLNIPAKIINSPETIAIIRQNRDRIAAEEDAQKKMLLMAEAGAKGGKAVKDMAGAPMQTGSALDSTLSALKGIQ